MPLAPHIIEWIKKREEEKKRREERPQPQLPVPEPLPPPEKPKRDPNDPDGDRGVVIIEPEKDEGSTGQRGVEIISFF
ncbi:MAG TPA: hypothetical protein VL426_03715 [Candidatus Binatia bacterium]|nr:hypothetical protein [Candidatus Binatia bacterium]